MKSNYSEVSRLEANLSSLLALKSDMRACALCPRMCASRRQVVPPRGPEDARVMVIAQAPGSREDVKGEPLIGRSGRTLERLLEMHAGIDPKTVWYDNTAKCYPGHTAGQGDKKPTKKEAQQCVKAWLLDEIALLRPKLIILLGDVPLQIFMPGEKLSQVHGQRTRYAFRRLAEYYGREVDRDFMFELAPMYHPAAAMYDARLQPVLINDFRGLRGKPTRGAAWDVVEPRPAEMEGVDGVIAIDFETTTPEVDGRFAPTMAEPIGVAASWIQGEVKAFYAPSMPRNPLAPWRALLESERRKVCHNLKFEYMVARRQGVTIRAADDTKLMASLLGMPSTRLKDLSGLLLHVRQQRYEEWDGTSPEYPSADAACALLLRESLLAQLEAEGLRRVYEDIELPLVPVLAEMEMNGVRVDLDRLAAAGVGMKQRMDEIAAKYPVYDLQNDNRVRDLLFLRESLPVRKRTRTGLASVEKPVLEALNSRVADDVLRWRELNKLHRDYVLALPKMLHADGRVRGSFNQAGRYEDYDEDKSSPATGRLSSSHPNLQNVPVRTDAGKLIRRCFVPEAGWVMVKADVGQEEPRIAALLSGDTNLAERLDDPTKDIYLPIGQLVYDMTITALGGEPKQLTRGDRKWRDLAKKLFLAKLYGARAQKLRTACLESGVHLTTKQAADLDKKFDLEYTGVAAYAKGQEKFVREHGYVQSYFGRKRWIPKALSGSPKQQFEAVREAANTPIQGTAADVMKLMLRRVYDAIKTQGLHTRMLLTVHDEIVCEVPPDEVVAVGEVLRTSIEGLLPVPLPLEITVGDAWYDPKAREV